MRVTISDCEYMKKITFLSHYSYSINVVNNRKNDGYDRKKKGELLLALFLQFFIVIIIAQRMAFGFKL